MNKYEPKPDAGMDVAKAFEQNAMVREVRIPMTQDKTAEQSFIKTLRLFMADNKVSQKALAEKIGVSDTAISQLINGRYPGDTETLIKKIADYCDTVERRKKVDKGAGYVDTTVARKIFTVIKQTQAYSDDHEARISLVVGDSGHGKSICLKQFARVNANSVYVLLDDTMSSAAVFSEIAKALKIDFAGGVKTLTARIVERLAGREMTVILDEASALDVHKLNQLRQIVTVRCKCPLIVAGNAHLLSTVNQDVMRRGYESLDQFRSRMLCILNLDELAAAGGGDGGLYSADEIRKMYEYGGISLTRDAVKRLQSICRTGQTGRLRTCSIIIAALHKAIEIQREEIITGEHIVSAIVALGLPIKDRLPVLTVEAVKEDSQAKAKTA